MGIEANKRIKLTIVGPSTYLLFKNSQYSLGKYCEDNSGFNKYSKNF